MLATCKVQAFYLNKGFVPYLLIYSFSPLLIENLLFEGLNYQFSVLNTNIKKNTVGTAQTSGLSYG